MAELSRKQAVLAILGVAHCGHPLLVAQTLRDSTRPIDPRDIGVGNAIQQNTKTAHGWEIGDVRPSPTSAGLYVRLADTAGKEDGISVIEVRYNDLTLRLTAAEIWQALAQPLYPLYRRNADGTIEVIEPLPSTLLFERRNGRPVED